MRKRSDWMAGKNNKPKNAKSITIGFLDFLLGIAEGFVISIDRKEVYRRVYGHFEQKLTVEKIAKHFDSLRRRGYLELSQDPNGNCSVKFTNKAKLALVDKIADRLLTDQNFYFISFDIPERLRTKRNAFRRIIKRLGFKEIQKSLWVYNKNVGVYVELAAKEYNVEDYIVYFVSNNTNINSTILSKLKER
jgi:hypothetical protein